MSSASMNEIKARIKSVKSTMQITKAMELVASSKIQKARVCAENAKKYCSVLNETLNELFASPNIAEKEMWAESSDGATLYIVVAGDRGMAGGYNSNVIKLADSVGTAKNAVFLPIGKKVFEKFKNKNRNLYSDGFEYTCDVDADDCLSLSASICDDFISGKLSRVEIIYTEFVSMLTQAPVRRTILPVEDFADSKMSSPYPQDIVYDGNSDLLLYTAVRQYVFGLIYYAVCDSIASEYGARRIAMNSANKNAADMIDSLTLTFNRARQSVITQEITEIISGAEAL